MTKLVITTETKAILRSLFEGSLDYMIFITNDDIVFNKTNARCYSVGSMRMVTYISYKQVYFHKKCSYPDNKKIHHYHEYLHPEDHFYWNIPAHLYPIYCYGLAVRCKSDTINEIIRDYSKLEEEQKMLHFHAQVPITVVFFNTFLCR